MDNASLSASIQKKTSRVSDNFKNNTYLLYQSIMATRYKKPFAILMYVMAADQT
jgi:hypothetical protein